MGGRGGGTARQARGLWQAPARQLPSDTARAAGGRQGAAGERARALTGCGGARSPGPHTRRPSCPKRGGARRWSQSRACPPPPPPRRRRPAAPRPPAGAPLPRCLARGWEGAGARVSPVAPWRRGAGGGQAGGRAGLQQGASRPLLFPCSPAYVQSIRFFPLPTTNFILPARALRTVVGTCRGGRREGRRRQALGREGGCGADPGGRRRPAETRRAEQQLELVAKEKLNRS